MDSGEIPCGVCGGEGCTEHVFRELLIGCGYPPHVKKLPSVDGNPHWRNLITLDHNPRCHPHLLCDLNFSSRWHTRLNCVDEPVGPIFERDYTLRCDIFDEIHAYEVLEHLGQQGDESSFFRHFSEIWRILKPHGHLYATVPSRFSGWLWGDPSHRRAIVSESLVFLNQKEYIAQCDLRPTGMSDFRDLYRADFEPVLIEDNRTVLQFILQAIKPSRWVALENRPERLVP